MHLDEHIFCRGNVAAISVKKRVAEQKKEEQKKVVVYSFKHALEREKL